MHFLKKAFLAFSITVLGTSFASSQDMPAAAPDRTETFKLSDDKSIELDYYLPDDFDRTVSYPVMLAPGSFFLQDDPAVFGWVVIRAWISDHRFDSADAGRILDHVTSRVKPRYDRFYIMGFSANSAGVFRVVAALNTRFAGILAIPGHPRKRSELEAIAGIKIRFIVGENDNYWLGETKKAHNQLLQLGADTDMEIVPNGGHVLRQLAGTPLFKRIDDWFR